MKSKVFIVLLLSCFLTYSVFSQEKTGKQLKAERELQKQKETEALINAKNFVFEAQKVMPQGGRLLHLDYNTYFLNFSEKMTTCDLPFFGRAYNVGYGGTDGGIKFEGVPENVQIEKKKKYYIIKASVKGKDDSYDLLFSIYFDGSASLSVNSNKRASISYDGEIHKPKPEETKE